MRQSCFYKSQHDSPNQKFPFQVTYIRGIGKSSLVERNGLTMKCRKINFLKDRTRL